MQHIVVFSLKPQPFKTMDVYYTARGTYDKDYDKDGMSWDKYIVWSKLTHLTELVSVDNMLNELLVNTDHKSDEDWENIVTDENYETGFFKTLQYVLTKITKFLNKYRVMIG